MDAISVAADKIQGNKKKIIRETIKYIQFYVIK